MNSIALIVILILLILVFSLLFLSFIKAEKHLRYLKMIYPDEYAEYRGYTSAFHPKHYNIGIQFLVMPYLEREKSLEDDSSKELAIEIKRIVEYQFGVTFFLVLFFLYVFLVL